MMTVTDWIQAISTVVLVIVTAVYAWLTHKMAREMTEQRYGAVRPILDIDRLVNNDKDQLGEASSATNGDYSFGLSCIFKNIGLGPAVDVSSTVQFPSGECRPWDFGTLGARENTSSMKLELGRADKHALKVTYRDSFGRLFESSREVSATKEGWILGPLHTTLVKEVKK